MDRNGKLLVPLFLAAAVAICSGSAAAQLLMRSEYPTGKSASGVVTADFNGDGIMDMAVGAVEAPNAVRVYLGRGDGTFKSPVVYDPGTGANAIFAADVNHDGIPDLVVADNVGETVAVLLGKGDGTFQAPVKYAIPSVAVGIVLGDFNGDGNLDIAAAVQGDRTTSCACVSVLLGNGDGTFQEPGIDTYPDRRLPLALAAGYFNGDKNLDLAVIVEYPSYDLVQILLGKGDGSFSQGQSYVVQPNSLSIAAADLRNNGKTDLVVAELEGIGVAVLLGNGDGTFEQAVQYRAPYAEAVAVGDMNGDGIPDVVAVGGFDAGQVYIFPGNGDGTFRHEETFGPIGGLLAGLALADFNGDHQLDAAVADSEGDYVYAVLNTGTVSITPFDSPNFGSQLLGATGASQTVTVKNESAKPLAIDSIRADGEFSETSTCPQKLASGVNCTITVSFSPETVGPKSGVIQILDSASTKPQEIALSGAGTDILLAPASVTFPATKIGSNSAPQSFTLTNYNSTSITIKSIAINPVIDGNFVVSRYYDCTDAILRSGASCTFSVAFTPKQKGTLTAQVMVSDTDAGSPQTATLTGTGVQ